MEITRQPIFDVLEGLFVSDVIDKDDTMSTFVIGIRDCLKSFLAGSIPDLYSVIWKIVPKA